MIPITVAGKYEQLPRCRCNREGRLGERHRLAAATLLPFAAGYFLSYAFRTINGSIAGGLAAAFDLGPRDLGVLTSLYFLTFAICQIPAGLLIDRYGPRRVQAGLFLIATAGAFLFASAHDRSTLMLGRALIGLGCSGALVTGVKAIALWMPPERRVVSNALLVMCGGLGAMSSSVPVGAVTGLDWRALFTVLGTATLVVSGGVWWLVPDLPSRSLMGPREVASGLARVLADRRFRRLAPLSASVVGAAFAIHGLWAARWLADVAGFGQKAIGLVLLIMGAGLTGGAMGFGVLAQRLGRRGVTTSRLFGAACTLFIVIECVIALRVPVPPVVSFGMFATFGAITVLSFTMIGELFPPDMVGRANGLLNTLHLGTAFAIQAGIGALVALWPAQPDGQLPGEAYAVAIGVLALCQAAALAWFASSQRQPTPVPSTTLFS